MRLIISSFLYFASMDAGAQINKFDTLWNELTFNIYTGKPDSLILPFLRNHFPYLTKLPESGGWTVYPPGPVQVPQHGMHSLRVSKHPCIQTRHSGARLDFLTQEWNEGPPGIERIRIWIYFPGKPEAETARTQIIKKFEESGALVDTLNLDNPNKVTIRKSSDQDEWMSLSIVLKKSAKSNDYSMLILFYDDAGEPW